MPKQKTDDLIQLIKSLTRAEKRHFRLFVRRNQASDDILFLQLFDFLDKHKEYDESLILKKLPGVKKRQLSNLKAHLYKQLLISLRLLNTNHVNDIQLREMIDYGVLPPGTPPAKVDDVYALDQAYWRLLQYRPENAQQ